MLYVCWVNIIYKKKITDIKIFISYSKENLYLTSYCILWILSNFHTFNVTESNWFIFAYVSFEKRSSRFFSIACFRFCDTGSDNTICNWKIKFCFLCDMIKVFIWMFGKPVCYYPSNKNKRQLFRKKRIFLNQKFVLKGCKSFQSFIRFVECNVYFKNDIFVYY